ncbi:MULTISPECIES: NAD(+)--rifampin ADP-ribosyltransferase [unclassified Gordonia (in: high G+C Gram-positive bacteria)]|uniref:NAD(+)--rifampin ADP-ribosyltransferase n=1 Tax=unclassified Gordonia (in: high G+C Gram-positive bacteria) TaxID=2657482 RepID=UPI00071DB545|nr:MULTISPECIES: NAD(+)--rifampin ADP-ribosyltransferase [unclassified Gordonia (in: high G+C Gram-positive bacteria)]KSU54914.1 rifampin ADP-ribosyl transferase [Gordonia sp. SGD-V-85]MBR7192569.1 NAD(+)--rifampin ADP-ribosyltransferase [Gordonia sp. SCSIO 19800]SCC52872.1 rifampin ADP-ribosylating transferase [Gordonia sp. v-85]
MANGANDSHRTDTPERFRVHESGNFFHGTKADLRVGDFLTPGHRSNYRPEHISNYVYMTKVLDGAVLAAEMAVGDGRPRVYIVEPQDDVHDDPNVTDKKFTGNPTHSYRSARPVRVVGEMTDWVGHSPEYLRQFRAGLEALRQRGEAVLYD